MKVLFLTRYPIEGASSRYRVYQYLPELKKLGVDCTVSSFMSADFYKLSFSSGHFLQKVFRTITASFSRLWQLRRYREYDIIYMQRELFPFGPPLVERWLKRRGARLVYDYDDALFINKPSQYNWMVNLLRTPTKVYDIFALSACVMAGNRYLRDKALEHAPRSEVFEVAEDADRIKPHPPHKNENGVVIGWLGSKTTAKYLLLVESVLREIADEYPDVRFEVMGAGELDLTGLQITQLDWSLKGELEALARFDIGIMPLPMEEWSEGKSGGKARTYMVAGVVPIVADIGYNRELIQDGKTGFLCETAEDWKSAICRAIEDAALRQRIGEAARKDVIDRFPVAGQAAKMRAILAELIASPVDAS
jgi:glycosyltransferase involved in cell wall biosynthesis